MFWDGKDNPRSIDVDIKAHSLYKFVAGTKVEREGVCKYRRDIDTTDDNDQV